MSTDGTTSPFGCLGCAWLSTMLAGSTVMVAALLWIDPGWLQPVLFWREPARPPEVIAVVAAALPAEAGPEASPAATFELWPELAVEGSYEPATGLTLRTHEGSELEFPAGAIESSRRVVVTPVVRLPHEMAVGEALPVGPLFDVAVGGQEHWSFAHPIRVSLPFRSTLLPDGFPAGEPAVAVWEDDHWERLPTTHDRAAGVLTADVPHASVLGVVFVVGRVGLGVAAGWAAYTSEPGQVLIKLMMEKVDRTYRTKNFAIHYISPGADRAATPPYDDVEYTGAASAAGARSRDFPRYITDLGVFLEEGRSWLPEVKLEVAEPWVSRWDVFVVPLAGAFGESGLGGPVVIDNDMRFGGADDFPDHLEYEMRRTVVHELIHVAQDDQLSNLGVWWYGRKWWMESTAEYLSVLLTTRKMGIKDPKPYYYIKDNVACPSIGWDGGATTTDQQRYTGKNWPMHWYSYARLLDWMAGKGLDVPAALSTIGAAGAFTEAGIDGILRGLPPGLGLVEYHATFARELYHANLWQGHISGADTVGTVLLQQRRRDFALLAERVGQVNQLVVYKQALLEDAPVVSALYPFLAVDLPADREARLVVQVEAPAGADDTWVFAAGLQGNPPYRGRPTPFTTHRPRPLATIVSPARLAAPIARADDIDRFSVIVTHGSFDVGAAPITIRRWLLMAPVWVQFARRNAGGYVVGWHEAELKTAGDGAAFKGYHVYRRRFGASDWPSVPLNAAPVTDELYLDTPADDGFYEYTVRVRDVADNLSEPAPLDADGDPFVGIWSGRLALVEGSIAELATRKLRAELAKAGPEVGAGGAPAMLAALESSLTAIDLMLRLGIPMTLEVRAEHGAYTLRPVAVLGKPLDEADELPLDRLGRYTIGKLPTTPQGDPVLLSLTAADTIERRFSDTLDDPELGRMRFTLKIDFKRSDREPPRAR